jgi:mono/diheme cytochrome c family protein
MHSLFLLTALLVTQAPPYPVVYIAGPYGRTSIANTNKAFYEHPDGCDLRYLDAAGTITTLVAANSIPGGLSVTDPCMSLDGQYVYYSHIFLDARGAKCADIWRVKLTDSTDKIKLTNATAEWSPPRGANDFAPHPTPLNNSESKQWQNEGLLWSPNNIGVWNVSPCHMPGGELIFNSNRCAIFPTKQDLPALQLHKMDEDGKNVEKIGHLNLGGALHPTVLREGGIAWSSGEQQGYRNQSMWGIWKMAQDGGRFEPLASAFNTFASPFHFNTQTSNGWLVWNQYYQNRVYGVLFVGPTLTGSPFDPATIFGFPNPASNPPVQIGHAKNYSGGPLGGKITRSYGFQRWKQFNLFPDQTMQDWNPAIINGKDAGASTHPAAGPNNSLLYALRTGLRPGAPVGTDPGARDWGEIGIYYVPDVTREYGVTEHVKIVDEPGIMECFPRAAVPYTAIHGTMPAIYNSESAGLEPGDPYGLVGTSSLWFRETAAPVNVTGKYAQGGDMGNLQTEDIKFIAIGLTKPNEVNLAASKEPVAVPAYSHGETNRIGTNNEFHERVAFYEDLIPIEKWLQPDGSVTYGPDSNGGTRVLGGPETDGRPDTSFLAKLPANTPFLFYYLDANKDVLGMSQTWRQLMVNEKYKDCNGCHAHNVPAWFQFDKTFAAKPGYKIPKLSKARPVIEWHQDIKPLFDQKCAQCHTFTRKSLYESGLAGENFISADSMLVKRIRGKGVPICPPAPNQPLTDQERELVSWWVGTGMTETGKAVNGSILNQDSRRGAFGDSLPPGISVIPAKRVIAPVNQLIVGAVDPDSGVGTISVKASFDVTFMMDDDHVVTRTAGDELVGDFKQDGERLILDLTQSVTEGVLTVSVKDVAGNEAKIVRTFSQN